MANVIQYINLNGGINANTSPELIATTDMQECTNFEYIGDKLKRRGGISGSITTLPSTIRSFFYDFELNVFLVFLETNQIYFVDFSGSPSLVGNLAGYNKPSCCKFGNKVMIASGGKLQTYSTDTGLITITSSPLCDMVYERFGRVVIAKSGDDNVYYSAVGDETSWTDDPNDDSSSKYTEIGYKDGGDIACIVPLATDMIIFKTNGKVYQLANEFPDWSIYEVGRNSDFEYIFGVENLGNEVVYMTNKGLKELYTVQEYGNIRTKDIGDKFNDIFNEVFHPTLWHLRRKNQLLIKPNLGNVIYAYNYVNSALTKLEFASEIIDIAETPTYVIVAIGNTLRYWNNVYNDDFGNPINCKIKLKKEIALRYTIIKYLDILVNTEGAGNCTITLNLMGKTVNLPAITWIDGKTEARQPYRLHLRVKDFEIELSSTSDITFNHIFVEVQNL